MLPRLRPAHRVRFRGRPRSRSRLCSRGGFSDVEVDELQVETEWDSAEEFTRFATDIVAPINAILDQPPEEVREATWAAVTEAARPLAGSDGRLRLTNLALVAAGSA
jgi:hypothetical protein